MDSARATSAAPPFFKPFTKEDTKTGYLDGALYHNCPVLVAHHERRTIWPDIADALPDVLLSIGTGINRAKDEYQSDLHSRETTRGGRHVVGRWERFLPVQMARITADRFDQILSCEATWSEFKARNLPQMPHQPSEYQSSEHETRDYRARESHRRHIRINPELQSAVPRLDAVDELVNLEVQTRQFLETPAQRMKIKEVANRLVASCFYFEQDARSVRSDEGGFECTGEYNHVPPPQRHGASISSIAGLCCQMFLRTRQANIRWISKAVSTADFPTYPTK